MSSPTPSPTSVAPAEGKLGVLTVGLGAVASTLIAGVELAKRGQGTPIGSMTQMGTIRLGKRTEGRTPLVKDFVPLARLEDIVWGAWDVFPDDAYVAASRAGVLEQGKHIESISEALRDIRPMKAAFERRFARNLDGTHTMDTIDKRSMLNGIRADINRFRDEKKVDRVVMIWCASTEIYIEPGPQHATIEAFEKAIDANDEMIAPSMLYAYAVNMITKKLPGVSGIALNGVAMAIAAIFFAPFAYAQWPQGAIETNAVWSVIGLGVLCTALAFVLFFIVMNDIGPARASLVTYINTAFAVVLGVIILSEPLTLGIMVGLPMVLVGSYFASRKPAVNV